MGDYLVPIYEFRCRECGNTSDSRSREIRPCLCGGVLRRVFHANIAASFHPHFNHSLGRYVSSERDFSDGLKRASEANSLATGTDHNYVPADITDMRACGATSEGLEHTERIKRDSGLIAPSTTKVVY